VPGDEQGQFVAPIVGGDEDVQLLQGRELHVEREVA
jgi:hypothetical protein